MDAGAGSCGYQRRWDLVNQHTIPKSEAIAVLTRAGFSREVIDEVASQLSDPIDLDRDASLLLRYGITREELADRMGGSP
jgi:hypothetical protein